MSMNFRYLNKGLHNVLQRKIDDVWISVPTVNDEEAIAACIAFHEKDRKKENKELIIEIIGIIVFSLIVSSILFYYLYK